MSFHITNELSQSFSNETNVKNLTCSHVTAQSWNVNNYKLNDGKLNKNFQYFGNWRLARRNRWNYCLNEKLNLLSGSILLVANNSHPVSFIHIQNQIFVLIFDVPAVDNELDACCKIFLRFLQQSSCILSFAGTSKNSTKNLFCMSLKLTGWWELRKRKFAVVEST